MEDRMTYDFRRQRLLPGVATTADLARPTESSCALYVARFALPNQLPDSEERADDKDRGSEVDKTEVPDRVEPPGVVRRESDCEGEHWRCDCRDPGPHVPAADTEPRERGDRETRRGDEAGQSDMQVADVVVEVVVERLDLVLIARHLVAADTELEEAVGEIQDEEDDGVTRKRDRAECHQVHAPRERRRPCTPRPCRDRCHRTDTSVSQKSSASRGESTGRIQDTPFPGNDGISRVLCSSARRCAHTLVYPSWLGADLCPRRR